MIESAPENTYCLDRSRLGMLESLSTELLLMIFSLIHPQSHLRILCKVSRRINQVATPCLYATLKLKIAPVCGLDRYQAEAFLYQDTNHRSLKHVRTLAVTGSLTMPVITDSPTESETQLQTLVLEVESKTCMQLQGILKKLDANTLRTFIWDTDIKLKKGTVEYLRAKQQKIASILLGPQQHEAFTTRLNLYPLFQRERLVELQIFEICSIAEYEAVLGVIYSQSQSLKHLTIGLSGDFLEELSSTYESWDNGLDQTTQGYFLSHHGVTADDVNLPLLESLEVQGLPDFARLAGLGRTFYKKLIRTAPLRLLKVVNSTEGFDYAPRFNPFDAEFLNLTTLHLILDVTSHFNDAADYIRASKGLVELFLDITVAQAGLFPSLKTHSATLRRIYVSLHNVNQVSVIPDASLFEELKSFPVLEELAFPITTKEIKISKVDFSNLRLIWFTAARPYFEIPIVAVEYKNKEDKSNWLIEDIFSERVFPKYLRILCIGQTASDMPTTPYVIRMTSNHRSLPPLEIDIPVWVELTRHDIDYWFPGIQMLRMGEWYNPRRGMHVSTRLRRLSVIW